MLLTDDIKNEVRRDNCFDFLRYLFAFSLILAHFCTLAGQEQFWFITGSMRVKAFFVITGFLVTYSFLRRDGDLLSYARKRFVRIVPAYLCAIVFCVMLGWSVTALPTNEFFCNTQTWKYIISNVLMLNWIEPELPQTFQGNLAPQMNGSLWSMKLEVTFYILVPLLVQVVMRIGKKVAFSLIAVVIIGTYNNVPVQVQYFFYFFAGMIVLLSLDVLRRHWKVGLSLAFLNEAMLYFSSSEDAVNHVCQSLEPFAFALVIVGIAYGVKPLNVFRKYDNITYGLFLYHFPVIQMLLHYGTGQNVWLCFLYALPITSILAAASWFFVEKPLMNKYN